jgi:hypothetical protein
MKNMKLQIIAPLFLMFVLSIATANEYDDKYHLERQANIKIATEANHNMSDQALMIHLEKLMKYLPDLLSDIKSQNETEQKQTLDNVRDYYASVGLSLPEQVELFKKSPELQELMAQTWSNDTLGISYAEEVILSLTKKNYQTIVEVAKTFIQDKELPKDRYGWATISENYPKQLGFINIEMIRVYAQSCEIYLYKGIGSMKSIGYKVIKQENGEWNLYYFNYLKSWDKILIDIDAL